MTGATFGGPVHTAVPDDGPDADADHPEIPFHDEPEDAEQHDADDDDDDDGSFSPGGSLHGEVPDLNSEWAWFPVRRSGPTHQEIDPDSVVDSDYDLYIEDLDNHDSEYGSCFTNTTQRTTCFLSEESMSEPRILVAHSTVRYLTSTVSGPGSQ